MEKKSYSHVLQKVGVLRNFTVAKVIEKREIDELKRLIKSVASTEEEYKQLLNEELKKLSDMHDADNPIPGILYPRDAMKVKKTIVDAVEKFCKEVRSKNLSRHDMAYLITAIINELKLTQADFIKLKEELEGQFKEDEPDDEGDEDGGEDEENFDGSDDSPPKF